MQIKILNEDSTKKEYEIEVPFETINRQIDDKILNIQKDFVLPGFRKGSVPTSLIRNKVAKNQTEEFLTDYINNCLQDIVNKYQVKPLGRPEISLISYKENVVWLFKIVIYVMPLLPKIDWSTIDIYKDIIEISKQDIQVAKNYMLKKFRTFKKADNEYSAKLYDKIILDFDGKVKGENFDGNKGENVQIILGENKFLDGFEKGCIGMKINETRSIDVEFPTDYPKQELSNQTVQFDIKVTDLYQLEDIDIVSTDILKKINIESNEILDEKISTQMQHDFAPIVRNIMKQQLFDYINDKYEIPLPTNMINEEYINLWNNFKKNSVKKRKYSDKPEEEIKKEFKNIARRRVKLGMLIADFSKNNDIVVTDEEIQKIVLEQASRDIKKKDEILQFYRKKENIDKVRAPLTEEKALDYILKKVNLKETNVSSKDFLKKVSKGKEQSYDF